MDRTLLERVICPVCGRGEWTLHESEWEEVAYADGPRREVRTGELECTCGRQYPVREFVLSFAELFSDELRQEAAFWDRFYLWNIEHGGMGFHDLKRGFPPFMAQGVREAFPFADAIDRYDIHQQVADHPLLRAGRTLLDIGVGLGWTSLHFARSGYQVTAFDPSLGPVQAAKAYAIKQGIFIEYMCAAVGYVDFREGAFDNVAAFHSLHHVPDLRAGLSAVQRWLRPGGGLAVDEHIANSALAHAIGAQLHQWAEREVFPEYRTISTEDLAKLPTEPHSALEDAGVHQVAPLLRAMFGVQYEKQRHVALDHYPLLYYLWKHKEREAFVHALDIANHLQEILRLVDPDGGEYITLVASNDRIGAGASEAEEASASPIQAGRIANDTTVPAAVPQANESHTDEQAHLIERVASLEKELTEQGMWAHSLEAAQKERDREIAHLRAHLKKVESGRVMRLLNRLGRPKG